ncbi:hypothetical protein M1P56_22330 [Streptomyces sp. HU2014]|uniref:hypothetical protein n=1 Tax=Streptomyces sp. HU2014 TaxID=2939414 RepID=UPI00200D7C06|nr:hypothetical protein [Streptomyces sp. HU2014]UQI46890.1 hypothetical protein M1P56_22330 [Streptomyces sp. HU2014]
MRLTSLVAAGVTLLGTLAVLVTLREPRYRERGEDGHREAAEESPAPATGPRREAGRPR